MSKTVDKILELADKISATCEGESQYIMMCGLIEVTTALLLDMDSDADHGKDECPFVMYTDIMNRVLNSKLEMQELEDMDETQETIH
jgi:aspartokinase